MDTETLTLILVVIIASMLSLMAGYIITTTALRIYRALMGAIPPGVWLAITVIALVVVAAIVGFLFGTTTP